MLTPEQKRQRKFLLTATDIARVAGLSDYGGPYTVWAEKKGLLPPVEETSAMRRGTALEPVVARRFEEVNGVTLRDPQATVVHPTRSWMGATPDRFLDPNGLVECKTTSERNADHWGDSGGSMIPLVYVAQVAWQMAVTQRELCHVAVLIGEPAYELVRGKPVVVITDECDFRTYPIARDTELEGMLIEQGEKFWKDHIESDVPPSVDASRETAEALRRQYPVAQSAMIRANAAVEKMAMALREAGEKTEQWDQQKELYKNLLKAVIGDSRGVEGRTWKITWADYEKVTVDWESICHRLKVVVPPKVRRECTKVDLIRAFRPHFDKE